MTGAEDDEAAVDRRKQAAPTSERQTSAKEVDEASGADLNHVRWYAHGGIWAATAGLFAAGLAIGFRFMIGGAYSSASAKALMRSLVDGGFYLASTTGGAAATVVALMLTVVGLARRTDQDMGREIYLQLRWISFVAVITVMLSVISLFIMSVPVDGSELPDRWIPTLYHTCGALLSLVTGLMIALMTMLLLTTSDVVSKLTPGPNA